MTAATAYNDMLMTSSEKSDPMHAEPPGAVLKRGSGGGMPGNVVTVAALWAMM